MIKKRQFVEVWRFDLRESKTNEGQKIQLSSAPNSFLWRQASIRGRYFKAAN
jgi:hypothetical protein